MHAKSLQSCPTLSNPMDYTPNPQAPLPMEFSRQEYWSGLPCSSPGDLPDPGIEPISLMSHALAGRFFTTSATWARTYSGNRNLAIDTISSCYFESLGMVHIDAPEFIIRSHHFIHHFTWSFPFPSDLILCLSLGQAFWEAFALTAYIIHLSSAGYIKSIEK